MESGASVAGEDPSGIDNSQSRSLFVVYLLVICA
jgi:hypothetical protein